MELLREEANALVPGLVGWCPGPSHCSTLLGGIRGTQTGCHNAKDIKAQDTIGKAIIESVIIEEAIGRIEECFNSKSEWTGSKNPGLRVSSPKGTTSDENQHKPSAIEEFREWQRRGVKRVGYKGEAEDLREVDGEDWHLETEVGSNPCKRMKPGDQGDALEEEDVAGEVGGRKEGSGEGGEPKKTLTKERGYP